MNGHTYIHINIDMYFTSQARKGKINIKIIILKTFNVISIDLAHLISNGGGGFKRKTTKVGTKGP